MLAESFHRPPVALSSRQPWNPMNARHFALRAALGASILAPALASNQIEVLVLEGDVVPGVGSVTRIDHISLSENGEWLVEADTDHANTDADTVVLRNGTLFLREGQAMAQPAGATLDAFDSMRFNLSGELSFNHFLDGTTGINDDSGVYFGPTLVVQEGATTTATGFGPGTTYRGFFETHLLSNRQILAVCTMDDPSIGTSLDSALIWLQVDAAGVLLSETTLYKEGDFLPGQIESIESFVSNPHGVAVNDAGSVIFGVDVTGSTSLDDAVYLDGTLLAQEGSASPLPGRLWRNLDSVKVDLSSDGHWVMSGLVDGDSATDFVIVRDGVVIRQEGDTVPGLPAFQFTSFGSGPVEVSSGGGVLWYGDWDDPDTTRDTGLFFNDVMLVQEGVTMIQGQVVDTIRGIQDGYVLSDDGVTVLFEAILADGSEGVFRMCTGTTATYCTAKLNSLGCLPSILGTGVPSLSLPGSFDITAGSVLNNKPGILFYGFAANALPFQGGFLCVQPPTKRTPPQFSGGNPPPDDCSGLYTFDFNAWLQAGSDPGVLSGSQVFAQYWTRDPASPSTTGLSNGLSFTVNP